MKYSLGRYVYGLAAIGFGICALAWHAISNWHQIKALGDFVKSFGESGEKRLTTAAQRPVGR